MAWLFSLSVECGDSATGAAALGQDLASRVEAQTHQRTFRDDTGSHWVSLFFDDIDVEDDEAVDALARRLQLLLADTSLPFRFGLAGVEVDEARTWNELVDDINENSLLEGVILSRSHWEQLGKPAQFIPLGRHVMSSRNTA